MKILIYSPLFYPSVGGVESVTSMLAHEFVRQGQDVKLVCQVPATDSRIFPFEIIRKPNPLELLKLTRWCDIYFQGCVSLKGIWPLLIIPKPLIITHHTWYQRPDGTTNIQDILKLFVTRFATNISVSSAIAQHLPIFSKVINNPYQDDLFTIKPDIQRSQELVFLGRLVSDKGADILIRSLQDLKKLGLTPKLTLIGQGAEAENLRQQVQDLQLTEQVKFVGVKQEQDLVKLLNQHQILVIPSRWQEPFGIVALEGMACGCVVVGSQGGGLKEAIGPGGESFPNGNQAALSKILYHLLTHPEQLSRYQKRFQEHLSKHSQFQVAQNYLKVFDKVIKECY